MKKGTINGMIAGAITVIYTIIVVILGACGVISLNLCALLALAPILGLAVFTLVFIIFMFIRDFG